MALTAGTRESEDREGEGNTSELAHLAPASTFPAGAAGALTH